MMILLENQAMELSCSSRDACMIIKEESTKKVDCMWKCIHVTYVRERHLLHIWSKDDSQEEKINRMDSTARSKEKAHEKVKLKPYGMSLKKVLIVLNEGVPMEEVKRQQEIQIKREYMIPYTSQEGEVAERP
eukprot:Gb_29089 [translate_table: standard]